MRRIWLCRLLAAALALSCAVPADARAGPVEARARWKEAVLSKGEPWRRHRRRAAAAPVDALPAGDLPPAGPARSASLPAAAPGAPYPGEEPEAPLLCAQRPAS